MVMYDSLNRHMMPNYGSDILKMPNFQRLAKHSVTFDNCYVGSMPCMPARRELHTGRYNFLHRSWGPMEPFDVSMPEILDAHGVHTHLTTDHYHYLEDGGATYHHRYTTWSVYRGQEKDKWIGSLEKVEPTQMMGLENLPEWFKKRKTKAAKQNMINRQFMQDESDFPQAKTFADGIEFIERNREFDNWFLQIETFDPHEPFHSPKEYQDLFFDSSQPEFEYDWPPYAKVTETDDVVENVKKKYYALLTMCDNYLGKVLDMMDKYNMWEDTMLIVNTDHGYLLGEHNWWAKNIMPLYNEIAHTPLFIWDPRSGCKDERRQALVQTIDMAPTLLDYFEIEIPENMKGFALKETIAKDIPVRKYALFGLHSAAINITDGRYVYMRAPINPDGGPLNEYTLMPCHMDSMFTPKELQEIELVEPFSFTKECKTLKIPVKESFFMKNAYDMGNLLFDLQIDPEQNTLIDDPEKEVELINEMKHLMELSDSPKEQYERVGIPIGEPMTYELLMLQRTYRKN